MTQISDLDVEDLALYNSMSIFFCNININNFRSKYNSLLELDEEDFIPEEHNVWGPFVNFYDLNDLLEEVDNHANFTQTLLESTNRF